MKRFALLLLLPVAACSDKSETAAPPETFDYVAANEKEAHDKALSASGALLGTLITRLTNELMNKEPHLALGVCSDEAQDLSRKIRAKHGVDVHRTALRYRDPKNKPDAYERAWMEKEPTRKDVNPAGEGEIVIAADGTREYRFIRPLYLSNLCSVCHGPTDELSDDVKAALAERYPDDRATGFRPKDLRGVVSVRVPLAK